MMQQEPWNAAAAMGLLRPTKSAPCSPIKPPPATMLRTHFHVAHKVPVGDTPYVRAKRVQLVDKDPEKAIALFWSAINAGDRVDSALKDMAIVMKQQNRAEEAIEAIKSLRSRCSDQAQESLDNILLDLYKVRARTSSTLISLHVRSIHASGSETVLNLNAQRCGRLDDQISLLKHKLQLINQGHAFNGKRTKTARSQGRKFQVTLEQEATRLLGNLGWALMQKENYTEAEGAYRRALLIGPDNNKMCNLGICLMKQARVLEAKDVLKQVRPAAVDGLRGADSHLKAYERAQEMLRDLETKLIGRPPADQLDTNWLFDALLLGSSSSIWQPQPCTDHLLPPPVPAPATAPRGHFADENAGVSKKLAVLQENMLNVDAQPFYSLRVPSLAAKSHNTLPQRQQQQKPAPVHDPLGNLKRTRSGNCMDKAGAVVFKEQSIDENSGRRKSLSAEDRWPELPDHSAFDEALVAVVLAPVLDDEPTATEVKLPASCDTSPAVKEKIGKRLRIFQDITQTVNSF
ncbi:protein POLLENLESS 3-LIKE 2 isoform X1 [Zea mays]|uniref:Protein POLLENLESS 3-LIKE 2 n=1 Tax=Zea mays TaxID=4577 RepID=B4FM09_MAIZE|nr:protein POLLENLESS 3-LIKE 2 isoform X1 [Zea mays]ACF83152.1 unknown [Zea mays]ONM61293.1 Protein POLLENLESS 3-LIKE 2 [Zea mays]|eukprot:XP_008651103.1 protein POLLENLESS 3-LIKE 2 isoform X1 [Zea mays]